jgi:hypothetical protein
MNIVKVLELRYPGLEWALNGDSYSGLTWLSDTPKPTLEELQAQWEAVEFEIEVERIESLRKAAYREESDPIFFDYQRGEATEDEWLDAIQDIKDRYPYPVIEDES